MKHCCIVGGGAALAQPLIAKWLMEGHKVTAVCRNTYPDATHPAHDRYPNYDVITNLNEPPKSVDLLVMMPGTTLNAKLGKVLRDDWEVVLESCLTSVSVALNVIGLNDGASVVVVGSIVGSIGGYGCSAYAAAKAGLVGLVRSAALEWANRNIRVNLLELGYVGAGMGARLDPKVKERVLQQIPMKRFATLDEVVSAIDWLGRATYMSGDVLTMAGGMH